MLLHYPSLAHFTTYFWPSNWNVCSPLSNVHVLYVKFFCTAMYFVQVMRVGGIDDTWHISHTLSVKGSYATRWDFDKERGSYQPRMSRKNPHLEELWRQTAVRSSMKGQTLWRSDSRYQGWLNHSDFQMDEFTKTYWWWRQTWYRIQQILEVGILF